jgi:hypothetical protein
MKLDLNTWPGSLIFAGAIIVPSFLLQSTLCIATGNWHGWPAPPVRANSETPYIKTPAPSVPVETSVETASPKQYLPTPICATSIEVWRDYEANEVSADRKYKFDENGNTPIFIKGTVTGITKNILTGKPEIHLASDNMFLYVEASTTSDVSSLRKGDVFYGGCLGQDKIMVPRMQCESAGLTQREWDVCKNDPTTFARVWRMSQDK